MANDAVKRRVVQRFGRDLWFQARARLHYTDTNGQPQTGTLTERRALYRVTKLAEDEAKLDAGRFANFSKVPLDHVYWWLVPNSILSGSTYRWATPRVCEGLDEIIGWFGEQDFPWSLDMLITREKEHTITEQYILFSFAEAAHLTRFKLHFA